MSNFIYFCSNNWVNILPFINDQVGVLNSNSKVDSSKHYYIEYKYFHDVLFPGVSQGVLYSRAMN